jgi:hypothetical protein
MANQGCIDEGPDHRTLGWLVCPLQRLLSWTFEIEPLTIVLGFPPYLVLNVPIGRHRFLMIRAGWRYNRGATWRGYIFPTGACKIINEALLY